MLRRLCRLLSFFYTLLAVSVLLCCGHNRGVSLGSASIVGCKHISHVNKRRQKRRRRRRGVHGEHATPVFVFCLLLTVTVY